MQKISILMIVLIALTSNLNTYGQTTGSITGRVLDATTNEPMPGVNVLCLGTNYGAATDINGEFIISDLPLGSYQVRASAVGYNSIVKTDVIVGVAKPAMLEFNLQSSVIEIEGVTVTSDFFQQDPYEFNSVKSFSYEEIRRSPGGFEDVVRALSILPGVAQVSAGRNDLIVRGGAPSENLYLVDGLPVPNINHFGSQGATGGPLSFVNLDYVKETTFSTGGFASIYGDKLSSVLKIDLRDARKDRLGGKATISASQFGFNAEGPLTDNSSFLFSARRSYLDFIFNAAGFGFVPEYYDVLGKYDYKIDNKNSLSYLFIGAFDKVKFNNDDEENKIDNSRILGSNQNQYVTGISYKHLFNKGFFTVSLSRNFTDYDTFQNNFTGDEVVPIFKNKSREGENVLKADVIYKLSNKSELNFGATGKLIKFEADVLFPSFLTSFGDTLQLSSLETQNTFYKYDLYAQYNNTFFNRIKFTLGGRMDYFNGINNKYYFSPRLSLSYIFNNLTNISFSTGIYHQSPSYIWLAADERNKDLEAVKVNQFIVGIEHRLREDIRVKVEGFYKDYSDYPTSVIRPYLVLANTGAGFAGSDDNFASFGLEHLVSEGFGDVRGIEFSMQKKSSDQPHYGLISVTYSEANFVGLDGIERAGSYDQRWIVNLTAGYAFNEKWEANFKFRFATGSPYTPFESDGSQRVDKFNTERFSPIHSLDIRVDRRWNLGRRYSLITYLDVQNIYNRKNQTTIRWDQQENKVAEASSIGLLPSIGISLEF